MHQEETNNRTLVADEDILKRYQILTELKNDSSVLLVKASDSGELLVMKYKKDYNYQVMSRLKDWSIPGIPRIYELREEKNHLLIIEEYIHGKNLKQIVETEGLFSEEKAVEYFLALCSILKELHSLHPPIIHRDIKPENIILTNDGKIRLIDFNGSKEATKKKPQDTVMFGTHQYAAPEQYGFGSSDCRTDIYQIGVTLNLLLTGSFPIDSLYKGRLGPVIQKCIRYDAKKRYQSIHELEEALVKPGKAPSSFPFMIPGFRSRKPWKMVLASLFYGSVLNLCFHLEVREEANILLTGFRLTTRKIGSFFILVLPVFLVSDYGGIQDHLPHSTKVSRFLSVILAYAVLFVLIIALISLTDSIYFRIR